MRGKLTDVVAFVNVLEDHPRGCGENAMLVTSVATEIGSPPRMRGKPCHGLHSSDRRGITPADAGKTLAARLIFSAG